MQLTLVPATTGDAAQLAALHTAIAEHLNSRHGKGPWSWKTTEKGVLHGMRILVMRDGSGTIATLRLATKNRGPSTPAILPPCRKSLYLLSMAVALSRQGQGIGRQ